MANVQLKNINKIYPNNVQAVFDFNLDIKDKEFVVFVGPSGCGKSTTLRMIAGLEEISTGQLYIDDKLMNEVSPANRNIAMVFQSYALYPHMTVFNNMAFALRLRKFYKPILIQNQKCIDLNLKIANVLEKIKKLNKFFKKNQNNFEIIPEREALYNTLFDLVERRDAECTNPIGKDVLKISLLTKEIKKLKSKIKVLEKKNIEAEKALKTFNDKYSKVLLNLKNQIQTFKQNNKNYSKENEYKSLIKQFEIYDSNATYRKQKFEFYSNVLSSAKNEFEKLKSDLKKAQTEKVPLTEYRHLKKLEIEIEVNKAARALDLDKYIFRRPAALSGGQRQRVALGRCIVRKPKVFLMDEPLSNLDAKLRVQTRSQILDIHKNVGATTIYVTHDQTEAMTMADRIVVMKDGYIQQIGTPKDVYNHPVNKFVGGFLGSPSMNFLTGIYSKGNFIVQHFAKDSNDEKDKITYEPVKIKLNADLTKLLNDYEGQKLYLGIRPEDIYVNKNFKGSQYSPSIKLIANFAELLGHESIVYTNIAGARVAFKTKAFGDVQVKEEIKLQIDFKKVLFFDFKTENVITKTSK